MRKCIYSVLLALLAVSVQVDVAGQDSTPPTAPGNVSVALAGTRFVTLTWDASTDDSGAVTYEVEEDGVTPAYSVNGPEWTSPNANLLPETSHNYRVRAVDAAGNGSDWQTLTAKTIAEVDGTGYLLGQIFDGIPGGNVSAVVYSDAFYDKTPTRAVYMNGLDFNAFGDEYGILITGVLTAPKTGQFDFFIRSDDASQFFLNETGPEIPQPDFDLWIAEETGCCNSFQEVGASQTTQVPISLTAGNQYGFAFVVAEGGGGDYGQVAMREVGDTSPAASLESISGSILSGKIDPAGGKINITKQPVDTAGEEGSFVPFTAKAEILSPYGLKPLYQWNKGGEPIPGETTDTLFLRNLSSADAGVYSVTITSMGSELNSNEATLSVVPPGQLPSGGGGGSLDVRVSSGSDDSEEHINENNAISLTSSDLELGSEGGGEDLQEIGVRFQNITVPAGATITEATIQFTVDEADDEPTSLLIYGELNTDPIEFNGVAGNITGRTKTTAFVEWNDIPPWDDASIGSAGPDQLTPDLSSIVQELISQDGWGGGAMAFIIVPNPDVATPGGERTAESFDGTEALAPLLHIDYSTGGSSLDVRVSSGSDDSEEHINENNAISLTSSDLELGSEGGGEDLQEIGVRFQNITVPASATITKASIQFTVDEADDEPTSLLIYGELSTDPIEFNGVAGNITGRTKTDAFVEWNDIPPWDDASIGSAGPDQLTPDLSSIVQELVSQDGWGGGAMAFIIVPNPDVATPGGERTAESFDGTEALAPLLHIEYVTGGGGGGGGGGGSGLVASGGPVSEPTVVNFGELSGSASYEFVFTAVRDGASTAIAGDDAFAIKLDQWNQQGVFGTTQFGVADNLFTAVAGQSADSVFDRNVHVVIASDADAGESSLYVDGTLVGTWAGTVPLTGDVKVMGARLTQATDHMGAGSTMDHWATYNEALSDSQIADLAAVWVVPSINVDGLVAYWGFDGDLSDSVGSLDGTAQGPVGFVDGQAGFGQAISLDGTGFVEIMDSATALDFAGGSLSISGWFTVGSFDKSWQALIAKGEQSAYRVARRGGGAAVAYAGGVGEGADDAPAVDDGGWHHFVAISDADAAAYGTALYIDGVMYGVQATAPALEAETTNLYIGENPEALNRQWIGSIDDIGLWNRVLSADEVSALYNGGAGTALSTAVGGGGGGSAISIDFSATGVTVTFEGTLQSSDSVTGPYTDVAGATSPADIPLSGAAQFFRSSQ